MSDVLTQCSRCKGRGKLSTAYREVLDATGSFYDQNVVYGMRSITIKCKACKGTGQIEMGEK